MEKRRGDFERMKRINLKIIKKIFDESLVKDETRKALEDFEVDVRRKYEATKKMGLFERELWLSRLVIGILADVPERILLIIDNYWEELLKE